MKKWGDLHGEEKALIGAAFLIVAYFALNFLDAALQYYYPEIRVYKSGWKNPL